MIRKQAAEGNVIDIYVHCISFRKLYGVGETTKQMQCNSVTVHNSTEAAQFRTFYTVIF
jgi:hypothetical protein